MTNTTYPPPLGAGSSPGPGLEYNNNVQGGPIIVPDREHADAVPPSEHNPEDEAGNQRPDTPRTRTRAQNVIIMLALSTAAFLSALDMTIVATAMPTIVRDFNSTSGYVWIGSVYMLGSAAVIPTWGRLSDIWGRKGVLIVAVASFWIGSLVCGLSNGAGMMIAGRAIQGVGGGGIIVLVNICISDLYSEEDRGLYYGVVSLVWAVASAVGPVLGGAFTTTSATWRWCFYINLPVAGVAVLVLAAALRLHNPHTPVRDGLAAVDWLGSLAFVGATLMLLIGIQLGGVERPWGSAVVVCLIVFSVVLLAVFVAYEGLVPRFPLVPLRIFEERSNVWALLVVFFNGLLFMCPCYWVPLYFQSVLRRSALMSGVLLLAYCLSAALASVASGLFIKKTRNYKKPMVAGSVVAVLGVGLLIDWRPEEGMAKVIIYQLVLGAGIGPVVQSPMIALQAGVKKRDIGAATSFLGFVRQVSAAISVVIGGAIFSNGMVRRAAGLQAELGPEIAGRLGGSDAAANVEYVASLEGPEGDVARLAYADSMRAMFIAYTVFAVATMVSTFGVRSSTLKQDHTEYKTGLQEMQLANMDVRKGGGANVGK